MITRATQTLTSLKAIDRIMSLERERPPERTFVARKIEHGRDRLRQRQLQISERCRQTRSKRCRSRSNGGERVGIIGRVGSGKTTVGRLMAGFYDPDEGTHPVDGIDSRQYDPADLRAGLGFVLQDTDLFFGKLRDNIALGKPDATDEEVLAAARLAGVESFIAGHPLGYDMPISEGGTQPLGRPEAGDRTGPRPDPQSQDAVSRRADRAFRHPQRRPNSSSG